MTTAQDIYDSLRNNPDYLNLDDSDVEREAIRRARQHANNEKALSMAVQNSAVNKFTTFVNGLFFTKELNEFDKKVLANYEENRDFLRSINLKHYEGDGGWSAFGTGDIADDEHMLIETQRGPTPLSIYQVAEYLLKVQDVLSTALSAVRSNFSIADVFEGNPSDLKFIENLLDDDGKVLEKAKTTLQDFNAHPKVQEFNDLVAKSIRGTGEEEVSEEESPADEETPTAFRDINEYTNGDTKTSNFDDYKEYRPREIPSAFGDTNGGTNGGTKGDTKTFNFDAYKEFLPREINGENAKVLLPRDENGNEYNPFADGNNTNVQREYARLKAIFKDLHEDRTHKPTLGRGYFPSEEVDPKNPYVLKFLKPFPNEDQVSAYNELNTNKAIIEEYLRLFANIQRGTQNAPWQELIPTGSDKENAISWDSEVWSDPEEAGDFVPGVGTWHWYSALGSVASADNVGERADGAKARDEKGNMNFHIIPSQYFQNWRYDPSTQKLGTFVYSFGIRDSDRIIKDWIEANAADYPDFTTKGKNNLFSQAWNEWGDSENPGGFLDWLNEVDDDGISRHQSYVQGTAPEFEEKPQESIPEEPPVDDQDPEVAEGTPDDEDPEVVEGIPDKPEQEEVQPGRWVWDDDPNQLTGTWKWDEEATEGEYFKSPDDDPPEDIKTRNKKIKDVLDTEWGEGQWGFTHNHHQDEIESLLKLARENKLDDAWDKRVLQIRRKRRENEQQQKPAEEKPTGMDAGKRQKLIDEYINTYRELYHQSLDPRLIPVLEAKDDKSLGQMHEDILKQNAKAQRDDALQQKKNKANNIAFSIKPLDQEHLTKDEILMRVRQLIHHQQAYGNIMDGDAKKVWKERMEEAHQLADAAQMDLPLREEEDLKEAEPYDDYGSTAWLERVGGTHVETMNRRNAHRDAVNQGDALRTNVNYKPWLVAKYNPDGSFKAFHDLSDDTPVDEWNLAFDEDNHYYFHGLDPEKTKEYMRYRKLKALEEAPSDDIPSAFGPPPTPKDPELAELEQRVGGADYKDIRERLDKHTDLAGAADSFYNKFVHARNKQPRRGDGSGEAPPTFYSHENKNPELGWYHPESESWINPHRYRELRQHMGNQTGAGRVVNQGLYYVGKNNPTHNSYAFAIPTQANQAKLQHGDQVYYVDHTGSIAHANNSFDGNHLIDHEQPQTVNGVIHDWYAQQIGNQIKANPTAFVDEQQRPRQVSVVDAPPAPPIQAMWLELESLGREPGSALARREARKGSYWERMGRGGARSKLRHPFSRIARDPLSAQELGQPVSWSSWRDFKQSYFDVIDYPQSALVSWVGKQILGSLIGGETQEDKVIRRIRSGYKTQAKIERKLRESANKTKINGRLLSDLYVAPGEQQARDEDYQQLKSHLADQIKFHNNQAKQAGEAKDTAKSSHHKNRYLQYQQSANALNQLDSKMPHHWENINTIYDTYLGKVNQAPDAEESFNTWGLRMAQPSRQQAQQPQQVDKIPGAFDTSEKPHAEIPSAFGPREDVKEIPKVFV